MNVLANNFLIDSVGSEDNNIVVVSPKKRIKFSQFLQENREDILSIIQQKGAVLFRRFKLNNATDFRQAVEALADGNLLDYENRSTPRTSVDEKVYTSTEYPAESTIPSHNENSYSHTFPNFLYFFCVKNSHTGGQTPIVDNAKIYQALDPEVVRLFEEHGVTYTRNYGDVDLPWQEVFNTDSQQEVQRYCEENNISYQWNGNNLRTESVRPATLMHPQLKENIWFNQAHLFHYSNLGETAQSLIDLYGVDGLPRNATFCDGTPIPMDALSHIREVIEDNEIVFDWQPSDFLIVDNLHMAHGRKPFEGSRKMLVMMSHAKTI